MLLEQSCRFRVGHCCNLEESADWICDEPCNMFPLVQDFDVCMYNMNGFRIETMYDYYIAMKSMLLVVKSSSHPFI
jgi:hypothetical protein